MLIKYCVLILVLFCSLPAQANNICNEYELDESGAIQPRNKLYERLKMFIPLRYQNKLSTLDIVIQRNDEHELLMPYIESYNGISKIHIGTEYLNYICRVGILKLVEVLYSGISVKSHIEKCSANWSFKNCMLNASRDSLDSISYEELERRSIINGLVRSVSTLSQNFNDYMVPILLHELSHHIFDHFDKIDKNIITVKYAEREADEFALLSSLVMALHPLDFVDVMGNAELHERVKVAQTYSSPKIYEKSACRAEIARLFSIYIIPRVNIFSKLSNHINNPSSNILIAELTALKNVANEYQQLIPIKSNCSDEAFQGIQEILDELNDLSRIYQNYYVTYRQNENRHGLDKLDAHINTLENLMALTNQQSKLRSLTMALVLVSAKFAYSMNSSGLYFLLKK